MKDSRELFLLLHWDFQKVWSNFKFKFDLHFTYTFVLKPDDAVYIVYKITYVIIQQCDIKNYS